MVTFVIGVFAAIGYVVSAAGAVLGGIFGAGVGVICASRWLGRVAVKREPLAVARPNQRHTAINVIPSKQIFVTIGLVFSRILSMDLPSHSGLYRNVTPVANCWIVENQLHFFTFE